MPVDMEPIGADISALRVVKKLSVSTRGAITYQQRYGNDLVCVRHRVDGSTQIRYTTVELLVDRQPIRQREDVIVGLRVGRTERAVQDLVRAAGGVWDHKKYLWRLPKKAVKVLGLMERIAEL